LFAFGSHLVDVVQQCVETGRLRGSDGRRGLTAYGCTSNAPTSRKQNGDPRSDPKAAVPLARSWLATGRRAGVQTRRRRTDREKPRRSGVSRWPLVAPFRRNGRSLELAGVCCEFRKSIVEIGRPVVRTSQRAAPCLGANSRTESFRQKHAGFAVADGTADHYPHVLQLPLARVNGVS